jgi:hypothetical protein
MALPASIRRGWKSLPETNTKAYYEDLSITEEKSFITMGLVLTALGLYSDKWFEPVIIA